MRVVHHTDCAEMNIYYCIALVISLIVGNNNKATAPSKTMQMPCSIHIIKFTSTASKCMRRLITCDESGKWQNKQ